MPALLGTVLGASVTLLADRIRWRRDHALLSQKTRREVYAAYLAALHTGSERIRAVVLGDATAADRLSAAGEAFRAAGVYQAREHVALLASEAVACSAGQVLYRLRDLRDLAARGLSPASSDYEHAVMRYDEALTDLRTAMRQDIGSTSGG
ncbi:hypothetical protein GCM10010361_42810 [Streptomyces olivaceiscleroticus]|uniref:Uncharacterized protein n=1 Tax=Streptomyces olivaceiscleroticus TaxID=68245 RepID=A0ABN1ADM2_9ACTN